MTLIPQRTVASQIAEQIRADIGRGVWHTWLPSERALSRTAQAGRNTVRKALTQLRSEGVIAPEHGLGYRVISRPPTTPVRRPLKTVGILIPEQIGRLRPFILLWIDELKDLLAANGCRAIVYESQKYYQAKPGQALERLVAQEAPEVWLLTLSSHPTQSWFAQRGLPCYVAGSSFADVALPSFDLDCRFTCRHAAGVLFRLGHQRIGLISRESQNAGDIESELGFLEGVRSFSQREDLAEVVRPREDTVSHSRALTRFLDRKEPITGIVVANSYSYLTVASLLGQRGLRIPRDVSLISRDDDLFLQYLDPLPARYVASPQAVAMKILGPILRLAAGIAVPPGQKMRMLPNFEPGGSIGRPLSG